MDRDEARSILRDHLEQYRTRSRDELTPLIDEPEVAEVTGPSGVRYQLEVLAVWDNRTDGDLRVMGAIDDGGLSAWFPLSEDFIMAPDGSFVGE